MTNESYPGLVEAIWLKRAKRGPMDAVEDAVAEVGFGLRGNANRGGRRQITIISRERWGGGAFAEVIEGGVVRVGDTVSWHLPILDTT